MLAALDTNRERKNRVKKSYVAIVKLIHEQNKKLRGMTNDENGDSKGIVTKNLPENCLPYAINLLAHNCKLESSKDEAGIKHLKEYVFYIYFFLMSNLNLFFF